MNCRHPPGQEVCTIIRFIDGEAERFKANVVSKWPWESDRLIQGLLGVNKYLLRNVNGGTAQ